MKIERVPILSLSAVMLARSVHTCHKLERALAPLNSVRINVAERWTPHEVVPCREPIDEGGCPSHKHKWASALQPSNNHASTLLPRTDERAFKNHEYDALLRKKPGAPRAPGTPGDFFWFRPVRFVSSRCSKTMLSLSFTVAPNAVEKACTNSSAERSTSSRRREAAQRLVPFRERPV